MYKNITINTGKDKPSSASILMIYTGGTMGMAYDSSGKSLVPFDFSQILEKIPELERFDIEMTIISFDILLDSSNVQPRHWIQLGGIIFENYNKYDGFIILHGTDTMAYTASGLSYLLENLNKPIIFTGAQLPIGIVRTDARENLTTAIEIAVSKLHGRPVVTEVCICFDSLLFRGNRAKKTQSSHFDAFVSGNYPPLAEAGVNIEFNFSALKKFDDSKKIKFYNRLSPDVIILKLFPGISMEMVKAIFEIPDLRAVVLETFGSGNAPTDDWLINILKSAIGRGIIIYNVSQCLVGKVDHGKYFTSKTLEEIGVLSGGDITTEAAISKLMFAIANIEKNEWKNFLISPARGEMD